MDKIFDEAEPMPPWRGHSMTGPITPLALSRKIELTERTLTARNQSLFLIFKKRRISCGGIDLKIDDIWGLDLFMTGRASAQESKPTIMALQYKITPKPSCLQHKINNLHKILNLFLAKFRGMVLNMG